MYGPGFEKRAVIIDHAGNYARFGLPDEKRGWDLTAKKKKTKDAVENVNVRQCPECYFTHGVAPKCPKCGFVYPVKSRQLAEAAGTLQRIEGFKLDTRSPEDCATYGELAALGRARGYKHGWANEFCLDEVRVVQANFCHAKFRFGSYLGL